MTELGPVIELHIGFDPLHRAELPSAPRPDVPQDFRVGLIDTGARSSAIDRQLATALPMVDEGSALGVEGKPFKTTIHLAQIFVPELNVTFNGRFMALDLSRQPYDALLGRDFLVFFDFQYHGPDGKRRLTRPN